MDISPFLTYLNVEKNYSANTVLAYENDLNQFVSFLKQDFEMNDLLAVKRLMIRSWIVSLMEDQQKASTISRKVSALKTYYNFLRKQQLIAVNPAFQLILPKKEKRLPVFVDNKQINAALELAPTGNEFEDERNKLIIELFYFSGIRLSELINLKVADVDCYNQQIKVLGKRNKERLIPLVLKFTEQLKGFMEKFHSHNQSDNGFMFQSIEGKKLYPKLVYNIVKTYLSQVGVSGKKSPHVLRHTFATHLLNHGADINAIKSLLGHESLAATQVYTHNTIDKLKNIHKQAHPRG